MCHHVNRAISKTFDESNCLDSKARKIFLLKVKKGWHKGLNSSRKRGFSIPICEQQQEEKSMKKNKVCEKKSKRGKARTTDL